MSHYETRQVKVYDRHDYDMVSEKMDYEGAYEYMRHMNELTVKYDGTEEDFASHGYNVAKKVAMNALIEKRERKAAMSELKPCPFCGGVPTLEEKDGTNYYRYRVFCEKCAASQAWEHIDCIAISRWNNRAESEEKIDV